jgi:hypothetical protein
MVHGRTTMRNRAVIDHQMLQAIARVRRHENGYNFRSGPWRAVYGDFSRVVFIADVTDEDSDSITTITRSVELAS